MKSGPSVRPSARFMASPDSSALQKVIFIDRDGVINVDPIGDYIKRWEDFRFEEGALQALKTFSDRGYEIIVISNQAGIGDGVYPESALHDIHKNMMRVFSEKGIHARKAYYCHHGKQAGCKCRKPEIGLFEKAAGDYRFDRSQTFFIGDKITDVQAGRRFGLKTIMVLTGHGKLEISQAVGESKPDFQAQSLADAVRFVP